MKKIKDSLLIVFKDFFYVNIALVASLIVGFLSYWLFYQTTTIQTFIEDAQNGDFGKYSYAYGITYGITTLLIIVLSGISIATAVWLFRHSQLGRGKTLGANAGGLAAAAFGMGCPVCGAFLLSAIGIAAGLRIFPLQGLELKFLSFALLMASALYALSKVNTAIHCEDCADTTHRTTEVKKLAGRRLIVLPLEKVAVITLIVVFSVNQFLITQTATQMGLATGWLGINLPVLGSGEKGTQASGAFSERIIVTAKGEKIVISDVIEAVTPKAGFATRVRWNDIVVKMVKTGILDPKKLEDIITNRYGQKMNQKWQAILAGGNANLSISKDNAVFMMYVLWTFAKHNENQILSDSPFAKYFKDYDIGVGRSGYGDTRLLALTPGQQTIAKKVAENAYRPCCGNSAAAPDCSHGYAALGLIQLMASQGFLEKEIFETFIKFNSFWFPETYIKNALYVKVTEGTSWKNVSKKLIAGEKYSTLQGSRTAKKYLKDTFGI